MGTGCKQYILQYYLASWRYGDKPTTQNTFASFGIRRIEDYYLMFAKKKRQLLKLFKKTISSFIIETSIVHQSTSSVQNRTVYFGILMVYLNRDYLSHIFTFII